MASYATSVVCTGIPASWSRLASRSMPASLLRQAIGNQNERSTAANAKPAMDATVTCQCAMAGVRASRHIAAVDTSASAETIPATKIDDVNTSRRTKLSKRGPPGKTNPALITAIRPASHANAARARARECLRVGRDEAGRHRRMPAATAAVTTSIVSTAVGSTDGSTGFSNSSGKSCRSLGMAPSRVCLRQSSSGSVDRDARRRRGFC